MHWIRSERGMTLVEMLVVAAITTVVMLAAYEMMESAVQASLFVEAHNDLPVYGQEVINLLQRELMMSREMFQADTNGLAYRNALRTGAGANFSTLHAPDSLLPIADITTQNILADTAGSRTTGNCILVARQLEPVNVPFDHDNNAATAAVQFPVDRYEFQYYYLAQNTNRNFSNAGHYLDLMQARSIRYADAFQLNTLPSTVTAATRTALYNEIRNLGLTRAWTPMAPLANAFFNVTNTGTLTAIVTPTITMDRIRSLLPAMSGGRISGFMNYTVAMRHNAIPAAVMGRTPIPRFAIYDPATPNFPSGFEVKFVGPAGSRKAFTRLVLFAHYGVNKYDSNETVAITSLTF